MSESFDKFSKNYNSSVNSALDPTGYDYKDFVNAKLQKLKHLFPYLVKEDFKILDFGCGVGNLFGSIPDFFPRAKYTGIDTSAESIREAKSKFSDNADFLEFDSDDWKSQKYDLIFSAGVFHHIPSQDHGSLINSLSAQLNPKGKMVIWEHNPLNPLTQRIVNNCILDKNAVLIPSRIIKQYFLDASLSNVQVIHTTFFPKILSPLNFLDPYLGWLPLGGQYLVTGEKESTHENQTHLH